MREHGYFATIISYLILFNTYKKKKNFRNNETTQKNMQNAILVFRLSVGKRYIILHLYPECYLRKVLLAEKALGLSNPNHTSQCHSNNDGARLRPKPHRLLK